MEGTLYEERIYSRWNIIVIGIVIIALLAALIRQLTGGPLGTNPAPNAFFVGMILLFVVIGLNFAALTVRVTIQGISVSYGLIRHNIPWGEVAGCRLDDASAIRYGGWGIRTGLVAGKRRLVYSVIGADRVVVETRLGAHQEFVFSTMNPEAVMKAIDEGLGRRS
jgi:hypothetical protein